MGFGLKVSDSVPRVQKLAVGLNGMVVENAGRGEALCLCVIWQSPSFPGTSEQRDAGQRRMRSNYIFVSGFVEYRCVKIRRSGRPQLQVWLVLVGAWRPNK